MRHASPQAPKRHRVYDHPVLASFLPFLETTFLAIIPAAALAILGITDKSPNGQIINSVCTILISLAVLGIYHLRFRDLDGTMGWTSTGMMLVLPALLLVVSNLMEWNSGVFNGVLYSLVMALAPGISEEIIFRSVGISNWMRVTSERRNILPCAVFSALYFGIAHAMNSLFGADPASTVFQVYYATCLGILFAGVYLRTGSILPCMIMHTLIDFTSFLFMDMTAGGLITEKLTYDFEFFYTAASSLVILVAGIYLLRSAKRDEIVELWQRKWHKQQEAEPEVSIPEVL